MRSMVVVLIWVAFGALLYLTILIGLAGYTFAFGLEPGHNFDVIGLLLLMFGFHRWYSDEAFEQAEATDLLVLGELRKLTHKLLKSNVIEEDKD